MHLDKRCHKNQNTKNLPQQYNYSSNNATYIFIWISQMLQRLSTIKKFKQNHILADSLPANLPTGTDLELITLSI